MQPTARPAPAKKSPWHFMPRYQNRSTYGSILEGGGENENMRRSNVLPTVLSGICLTRGVGVLSRGFSRSELCYRLCPKPSHPLRISSTLPPEGGTPNLSPFLHALNICTSSAEQS